MQCAQCQQLLSAYHDGELASDVRTVVSRHLEKCASCHQALEAFRKLSSNAVELQHPGVIPDLWPILEGQIGENHSGQGNPRRRIHLHRLARSISVAAAILLGMTLVGLFAHRAWFGGRQATSAEAIFMRYLNELPHDPESAQRLLLSSYSGKRIMPEAAANYVSYKPLAPERLPQGLTLVGVYVLSMPGCTCIQEVYQGTEAETLAIFEHADQQPMWFGDRPAIHAQCGSTSTRIIQVDGHLAATWKTARRHVTLVGARNVDEVVQLVTYLNGKSSGD